ncbi:hypothetical protein ACJMK2_007614 [Sinanodonta woodiana]|uniref:Sodefrin-like factor n=1 Tax=Sinanodonta woodiana TaxID=1069815 RepID=A0ABD3VKM2_SINWO
MASYRNIRAITEIYMVLCLLGSFEQVTSLMCYFCAGSSSKSSCLDAGYFLDGFKNTDGNPHMFKNCTAPFNNLCIIQEYRAGGNIASHLRDCSDGLTFAFPVNETIYNKLRSEAMTPRNRTSCIFNSILQVCLTTCNTDFCNGPQYEAPGTYKPQIPSNHIDRDTPAQ